MSKYDSSSEAITSNLMLWPVPNTQTAIVDTQTFEVASAAPIGYSDTLDFIIKAMPKHMIERIEIISEIRVLTATGGNPPATAVPQVSIISNVANALWRSVDVIIDNENLLQSFDNSYNIGAWFNIALNSPKSRAPILLKKELFLMDEGASYDTANDVIFPVAVEGQAQQVTTNTSSTTRAAIISEGKTVVLISDLNCSLLKTEKLLPTNMDIKISLTKNYDGYLLMDSLVGTHKIQFDKCYLRITAHQPSDLTIQLMEKRLKIEPALYHTEHGKVRFHPIPTGSQLFTINNLFPQGELPVLFTFGLQDRSALGNDRTVNPYVFGKIKKLKFS